MGYDTNFDGKFKLNTKLDSETHQFLNKFNETRRMARVQPQEYGVEGEFYVDGKGHMGQDHTPDIIKFNTPPKTQPGLWCQWRPTKDGLAIEWDGGENFYDYIKWIRYLIKAILAPRGYILNGQVYWRGDDMGDSGIITIEDNKVKVSLEKEV
jgi:hypothetical protein